MTKKEITKLALLRGYESAYSGHAKRFYFTRKFKMDIHKVINSK